jgi:multidrug efflux pump
MGEAMASNIRFGGMRDGMMFSLVPPSVDGIGNSAGFAMRLVDRANQGTRRA